MRTLYLIGFASLACISLKNAPNIDRQSFDRAVYQVVLDSLFIAPAKPGRFQQIVVASRTKPFRRESLVKGVIEGFYGMPGVEKETISDFEDQARENRTLIGRVPTIASISVVLAEDSVLRALPRENAEKYWNAFYKMFPGSPGIISLSPIGYDSKRQIAILMVDQGCGSLCGNGYRVSLRRSGRRWIITAVEQTWVS